MRGISRGFSTGWPHIHGDTSASASFVLETKVYFAMPTINFYGFKNLFLHWNVGSLFPE